MLSIPAKKFKRRMRRLAAIKLLGGKCVSCGQADPKQLEFSHELGNKEIPARRLWDRRWAVIKFEISKCVLRCSFCHSLVDPCRYPQRFKEDLPVPDWVTED